jgi:malate synthase
MGSDERDAQMMTTRAGLVVSVALAGLVDDEIVEGISIDVQTFWETLAEVVRRFTPRVRALLDHRDALQSQIDTWLENQGAADAADPAAYQRFLESIGYIEPRAEERFKISTAAVDPEISEVAGPQLVVPVGNARYALNAANARWGSLYDALYGTDALGSLPPAGDYDPARGARVVAWVKQFLDLVAPLESGSHEDLTGYEIGSDSLHGVRGATRVGLARASHYLGAIKSSDASASAFFEHHGLRIEVVVDPTSPIGRTDAAHVADVLLESAPTVVMDFEDSVSAVNDLDKVGVYRNWLGLMRRDLSTTISKRGAEFVRTLRGDREMQGANGRLGRLPGSALMLARNVGDLMTTDAVLSDGEPIHESFLDLVVTVASAMHDVERTGGTKNSRDGSIYIVKPKIHGSDEVALANEMCALVEHRFHLKPASIKIGLMDEERRTSVNLENCIKRAAERIVFVNTGFLDRTADELRTNMEAGPMVPKAEMRSSAWLGAYERRNVAIALEAGFVGRAQIGKGMWAAPDKMNEMLSAKVSQLYTGASCAWVPSPTAATLHAVHYHQVDVAAVQRQRADDPCEPITELLRIPLLERALSDVEIMRETENNAQGILGYVVRWVDQGIGCSKVPDMDGVALMEDRATCRISSQHIANWIRHGVLDEATFLDVMRRMAVVVDGQNAGDPSYEPMAPSYQGEAFEAACQLVLGARYRPSGYTEPVLHAARIARINRRQLMLPRSAATYVESIGSNVHSKLGERGAEVSKDFHE